MGPASNVGDAKDLSNRPLSGIHHKIGRFRRLFGDNGVSRLYVAIADMYETGCEDYVVKRTESAYIEAMLIWKFGLFQQDCLHCPLNRQIVRKLLIFDWRGVWDDFRN
jgi:hypothetical protein